MYGQRLDLILIIIPQGCYAQKNLSTIFTMLAQGKSHVVTQCITVYALRKLATKPGGLPGGLIYTGEPSLTELAVLQHDFSTIAQNRQN